MSAIDTCHVRLSYASFHSLTPPRLSCPHAAERQSMWTIEINPTIDNVAKFEMGPDSPIAGEITIPIRFVRPKGRKHVRDRVPSNANNPSRATTQPNSTPPPQKIN